MTIFRVGEPQPVDLVPVAPDLAPPHDGPSPPPAPPARPLRELRAPAARQRTWERRYLVGLLLADLVSALVAAVVSWMVRPAGTDHDVAVLGLDLRYRTLAVISVPLWLGCAALAHAYRCRHLAEGLDDYLRPVRTALQLLAAVAVVSYAFKLDLSRLLVVAYFPSLIVASITTRFALRQILSAFRRQDLAMRQLLLAGDQESVVRFAAHILRYPGHGIHIAGVCVPGRRSTLQVGGRTLDVHGVPDDLVAAAQTLGVDAAAVIGHGHFARTTLQQVAWQLERSGVDLLVAPDVVELAGPRIRFTLLTGVPLLHIAEPRIGGIGRLIKACYEWAVAVLLVVVTAPLVLLVAVVILVDTGRPVFYRQRRVGLRGKEFTLFKFRTMVTDAEARLSTLRDKNQHDGALFKIRDDPRITRSGLWLRKFSIDELPQLVNVLKGEMMLIGPRPCLPQEAQHFDEAAHRRFLVKPGLTGLWQVNGRSDIPWVDAVRLDLYYLENWSPMMDLAIVYRTLIVILMGRGC